MNNTTLVKFYNKYNLLPSPNHENTFYILYKNSKNKTKIYSFREVKDDKSIISFMDKVLEFEIKYPNKKIFIGIQFIGPN